MCQSVNHSVSWSGVSQSELLVIPYYTTVPLLLIELKPGHNFNVQLFVSMDSPLQNFPSFAGAGFEQLRKRFCKPSSHVFEQGVHMDQADQLPFTYEEKNSKQKKTQRRL